MTIRQFTSDGAFRQRYWARNHVGWRHMHDDAAQCRASRIGGTRARGRGVGADHPERRPAAHQGGQPIGGQSARHLCGGDLSGLRTHHGPCRARRSAGSRQPGLHRARGGRRRHRGGPRCRCRRRRHRGVHDHRLSALRRNAETRHRLLRRERAQRACPTSIFTCRRRGCPAGGRLVADGLFGVPVRPARGRAGHPGRDHQPRAHTRRRPGDGQDRQRMLTDAGAAGR